MVKILPNRYFKQPTLLKVEEHSDINNTESYMQGNKTSLSNPENRQAP